MKTLSIVFLILVAKELPAQNFIAEKKIAGAFSLVSGGESASILIDEKDDWLVAKAASLLQMDIEMVTGKKPSLIHDLSSAPKNCIIIGTMNHSSVIKNLIASKKITATAIEDKWEAFSLQTTVNPAPGIANALVITGSDKRGTAYGVFELSKQLGVSPWWWWADVPVKKKAAVYVKKGIYHYNSPSVKYRGIFINDEAPAFSGWTREKFGGVNHLLYEKIFELLLRLKANYLWPAMWGNAFNDDDTLNPVLADQWGIVMGTSHHEPMLRAQQEWKRYGKGAWDYTKNDSVLRSFWRGGIQHMGTHESLVTIGMRGDGDEPMTEGTATALLEKIVADQRKIIEEVTKKPATATPQIWALYKEVQDYYDKGMRVPDDVTLLLCDDNWGNIRKLPKLGEPERSGGYGIYYHFDYVGGPRNYKWINTNNIARVWEQIHLAKEHRVDKVWIVNVGDLKPMEFPISFFLDYAWDTKRWNEDNLKDYYTQWAGEQFGALHAKEIGAILRNYAQYASRRKPELLDENTYTVDEFETANREWRALVAKATKMSNVLPKEYKDAFFELVLHPVKAFANLHEMYLNVAFNHLNAEDSVLSANTYAHYAEQLFTNDSLISLQYHQIGNGKWNHMMDQTHIGYTYWQQPPFNTLPALTYFANGYSKDTAMNRTASAKKIKNKNGPANSFYEEDGVVSINAAHWTRAINTPTIKWKVIPDIGKDGSGITTFPVTVTSALSTASPHVEYDFYAYDSGKLDLHLYCSPTLNFGNDEGLLYAVSIDDEKPQVFSLNKEDKNTKVWESWVANNIITKTSTHRITKRGSHTVKYWMLSPAIILQKLVVDFGGLKRTYLGPSETKK